MTQTAVNEPPNWQHTIERIKNAVVSLHYARTADFDVEEVGCSTATGFVVDAERGYILTNHHVVGDGPFWGYCTFKNHEECEVRAIYRDPEHDFGLLRFEPKSIRYLDLSALSLHPELCQLGCDIKVMGHSSGEKFSIMSGVISNLYRNAPQYSRDSYCDFNTNYIQAIVSTSGGSSGGPVFDIHGNVVALNAGGNNESSAYFLPLEGACRALDLLRQNQRISRGTLQAVFRIDTLDACRRLGLTEAQETEVRSTSEDETGMLVVDRVLIGGPSYERLEEGDIVTRVNGKLLTTFSPLEQILDAHVGCEISISVQRGNNEVTLDITVGDLHAITPDRYVHVSYATYHELSYTQARHYGVAVRGSGVYYNKASFTIGSTSSEGFLVQKVDGKETPDLASFIEVMKTIPDRANFLVQYRPLNNAHITPSVVLTMDRHWRQDMMMFVRNDATGVWDESLIAPSLPAVPPTSQKAHFFTIDGTCHPAVPRIARSFVKFCVRNPLRIEGQPWSKTDFGYGLIVDAQKGLVVVSRYWVSNYMCDVVLGVAQSAEVEARIVFLHPMQNYAVLQYDPTTLDADVESIEMDSTPLAPGDEAIFVGYNGDDRPIAAKTMITGKSYAYINLTMAMPRWRAADFEEIEFDDTIAGRCETGVLVSQSTGKTAGIWHAYLGDRTGDGAERKRFAATEASPLVSVIETIRRGEKPRLRILGLETCPVELKEARVCGLSDEWIDRVFKESPQHQELLQVQKLDAGTETSLKDNDILLTINGNLVTSMKDLDAVYDQDTVEVTILRNKEEMTLQVNTVDTSDFETDRVVLFCGAILHKPHFAVRQAYHKLRSQIWITRVAAGSPADQYDLYRTRFVTHLNDVPVHDLDDFIEEARNLPDDQYFRVKCVNTEDKQVTVAMKKNDHDFPMKELIRDEAHRDGWRRTLYRNGEALEGVGNIP